MRASLTTPTGIDRVTEAYGRWLLSRTDVELIPVCAWGGFVSKMDVAQFKAVLKERPAKTRGLGEEWRKLTAALGAPGKAEVLRSAPAAGAMETAVGRYLPVAARTLANWRPSRAPDDAIYLNVSHFGLEQPRLLQRLTVRGIRPMVMIHDLIPILHPEYCGPSAAKWHQRRIDAVLAHAELVLTNSQTTATELAAFARGINARIPTIRVAPLGLEAAFLRPRDDALRAGRYFVCVGTIEPRKNLTFLLTLWRRLAERMGDEAPVLVLAGRRGWENESVIDHLERSAPIRRLVHETSGLGDEALARLIAGARALLAPSFIEGFNLPVAEALALGTPVIASDIPVHREVAEHARLIDPLDGPGWLEAIEAATRVRPTARTVQPLTWSDHFNIVADAIGLRTDRRTSRA